MREKNELKKETRQQHCIGHW